MVKKRGTVDVHSDGAEIKELKKQLDSLSEGEYHYVIYDKKGNRSLPQNKYLFGVVLKTISNELPDHPSVDALYKYFEELYAPVRVSFVNGEKYEYFDLKNENNNEVDEVIQSIINHAATQWGITIPERDLLKAPEAKELYIEANFELWKIAYQNSSSIKQ